MTPRFIKISKDDGDGCMLLNICEIAQVSQYTKEAAKNERCEGKVIMRDGRELFFKRGIDIIVDKITFFYVDGM